MYIHVLYYSILGNCLESNTSALHAVTHSLSAIVDLKEQQLRWDVLMPHLTEMLCIDA
jgi:hypothetical protein